MWNKNEIKGKLGQVKGKAKKAMGAMTGNDDMATAGKVDIAMGKARAVIGASNRREDAAVARATKAIKK